MIILIVKKAYYMVNNTNFIKYIIKKIVKVIWVKNDLDINAPFTDWYLVEKVYLDNAIIHNVIEEGRKYGLSEKQSIECINRANSIINFQPETKRICNNIDVSVFPNGQHLCFAFENSNYGLLRLNVIKEGKHKFIIIQSDIAALSWGDEFFFVTNLINIGTTPTLCVTRGDKPYPTEQNCSLNVGRIVWIEEMTPGITHEIIDSKVNFQKQQNQGTNKPEKKDHSNKKSAPTQPQRTDIGRVEPLSRKSTSGIITNYLWPPSRFNPISFILTDSDENIPNPDFPPFVVTRNVIGDTSATISINPSFVECLSDYEHRTNSVSYLVEVIKNVCEIKSSNATSGFESKIQVVEEGMLEYSLKKKAWILVKPPKITID